jgi:hypothetical protein
MKSIALDNAEMCKWLYGAGRMALADFQNSDEL